MLAESENGSIYASEYADYNLKLKNIVCDSIIIV